MVAYSMAKNLTELIEELKEGGVLRTPRIIAAFKAVDRKDFVLPQDRSTAYSDRALFIGYEQTISQPYTVAFMLELLEPKEGEKILDIGSGSGRTTALLGYIVGSKGHVYGVERIPELVLMGRENVAKYPDLPVEIIEAGTSLGLPSEAPFDRILVSAESVSIPEELLAQLRVEGVMVIPIEGALWKVTKKSEAENEIEQYEGFAFVPLIE
jgi:protein-L-isoaspartate(D-aspartate) O-methyltransferase